MLISEHMKRLLAEFETELALFEGDNIELAARRTNMDASDYNESIELSSAKLDAPLAAIANFRATTLGDLAEKARIASWSNDGYLEERIVDSILRDLAQLSPRRQLLKRPANVRYRADVTPAA